jgi:cytochrome c-type biogenesis protein
MIRGNFAYIFGVGMIATFNPCGFAMLPAYLAYFTGTEPVPAGAAGTRPGRGADSFVAVLRALRVGLAMTLGFVVVFATAGIIIETVTSEFQRHLPWFTMAIGVLLVGVGVVYLLGKEVVLRLPHLEQGGRSRGVGSMFVFGISYAVASLACTIPAFLVAVAGTFESESFASGVAAFVVYALGMGVVVTFLTVAVALARQGVVARARSILPYVGRVAGGLLVVAGAYMTWYGWWERQTLAGRPVAAGPVDWVTGWSGSVSTWISDVGPARLGLLLIGLVAIVIVLAWGWHLSRPATPSGVPTGTPGPAGPAGPPGPVGGAGGDTGCVDSRPTEVPADAGAAPGGGPPTR